MYPALVPRRILRQAARSGAAPEIQRRLGVRTGGEFQAQAQRVLPGARFRGHALIEVRCLQFFLRLPSGLTRQRRAGRVDPIPGDFIVGLHLERL